MTHKERESLLVLTTLCVTLVVATVGIVGLMWKGTNVSAPVSLAVAGAWTALAAKWVRK